MGSSQSVPEANNPTLDTTCEIKESLTENVKSLSANIEKNENPRKERKGYDLVQYKCRRRKAAYDRCYSDWYNKKFLTAQDINRDETCDELFEKWRECMLRGMIKEREREGLPPPKKGSMLSEFMEEQSNE
jgi:Uncharacterised protein family (UPF0203)